MLYSKLTINTLYVFWDVLSMHWICKCAIMCTQLQYVQTGSERYQNSTNLGHMVVFIFTEFSSMASECPLLQLSLGRLGAAQDRIRLMKHKKRNETGYWKELCCELPVPWFHGCGYGMKWMFFINSQDFGQFRDIWGSLYHAGVRQAWVHSPNRLISEARTSQVKTESTESSAGQNMALSSFLCFKFQGNLDLPTTPSEVN